MYGWSQITVPVYLSGMLPGTCRSPAWGDSPACPREQGFGTRLIPGSVNGTSNLVPGGARLVLGTPYLDTIRNNGILKNMYKASVYAV